MRVSVQYWVRVPACDLKKVFWTPVSAPGKGTVWDSLPADSIKLDEQQLQQLEALFAQQAPTPVAKSTPTGAPGLHGSCSYWYSSSRQPVWLCRIMYRVWR